MVFKVERHHLGGCTGQLAFASGSFSLTKKREIFRFHPILARALRIRPPAAGGNVKKMIGRWRAFSKFLDFENFSVSLVCAGIVRKKMEPRSWRLKQYFFQIFRVFDHFEGFQNGFRLFGSGSGEREGGWCLEFFFSFFRVFDHFEGF
jgi:hypothetical protein